MATASNRRARSAPTARTPAYWEQLHQEVRAVCQDRGIADESLTWKSGEWMSVLSEAIDRLYVLGRFELAPF